MHEPLKAHGMGIKPHDTGLWCLTYTAGTTPRPASLTADFRPSAYRSGSGSSARTTACAPFRSFRVMRQSPCTAPLNMEKCSPASRRAMKAEKMNWQTSRSTKT